MHYLDELLFSEVAIFYPVWQLAVPDQVVAVDLDPMRGSIFDVSITTLELIQIRIRQHIIDYVQLKHPTIWIRTVKLPRSGSVNSHYKDLRQHLFISSYLLLLAFCAFSGVIWKNLFNQHESNNAIKQQSYASSMTIPRCSTCGVEIGFVTVDSGLLWIIAQRHSSTDKASATLAHCFTETNRCTLLQRRRYDAAGNRQYDCKRVSEKHLRREKMDTDSLILVRLCSLL